MSARDDRGVAAVEAAIVTPIFLLVVIGVIEFGLAFKDQLAVTSAVRAGARIASAEPRTTTFATDAAAQVAREGSALDMSNVQALWVYQADASGHPVGAGGTFNSCATNCVRVLVERVDVRADRRRMERDVAERVRGHAGQRRRLPVVQALRASRRRSSTRSVCRVTP